MASGQPCKPRFPDVKEYLRTSEIAQSAGIHPNTVRLYAEWGFLAQPPRGANGYRHWRREDLEQALFAREALHGFWPGPRIRTSALALVRLAAAQGAAVAVPAAQAHVELVQEERQRARMAAAALESWAKAQGPAKRGKKISAREVCAAEDISAGQLRNWERNRLLTPCRNPETGHRCYGAAELGRLRVIRALLLAGYSVSAVLRMCLELDAGRTEGLGDVLNQPRPDEEVLTAFDRWQGFLAEQEERARKLLAHLQARG